MTPEQQREAADANCLWLEDTMAVLLVLLVLDRFADYHHDSATAPVRETAAQAIAIAAAASPQAVRKQLLEQLINMQTSQVWEVCSPRPHVSCHDVPTHVDGRSFSFSFVLKHPAAP